MRKANIYKNGLLAGVLVESEEGYMFQYDTEYLNTHDAKPISLTMPINQAIFKDKVLFSFFDGLIPEGWLLAIAEKNWKLNARDRMGLLLMCCKENIGDISVEAINEVDYEN